MVAVAWVFIRGKKVNPLWIILTAAFGVIGIVFFFLTEDMSLPMVIADIWAVVSAIILALGILSAILAFKRENGEFGNR